MHIASPAPRLVLGAPLALVVTVVLGMFMQYLVAQKQTEPPVRFEAPKLTIVNKTTDSEPIRDLTPQRPVDVVAPAPVNIQPTPGGKVGTLPAPPIAPPTVNDGPPVVSGPSFAQPAMRLFTPTPQFPADVRADQGSCTVRFDIDTKGETENVRVQSCTERGFRRAAETAVRRTVYRPAQNDRGPIPTRGVTVEIVFQLEQ